MFIRITVLTAFGCLAALSPVRSATDLSIATGGTDPTSDAAFAISGNKTISPATVVSALQIQNLDLQANADISLADSVNAAATGNSLTLQAGRSIFFGTNVTLMLGGNFIAVAGDSSAQSPPPGSASFTMGPGSGISTSGDIAIFNSQGAVGLGSLASGGTVRLSSSGAILQSGAITGSSLGVRDSGLSTAVTLTNANNSVGIIAANTSGASFSYANNGNLTVSSVSALSTGSASFTSTSGITASNVSLTVNGTLAIAQAISATNNVSLSTSGGISQTAAISGAGLELLGTGSATLTLSGNSVNTLAANLSADLIYQSSGNLSVGTVNSTTGLAASNVYLGSGGSLSLGDNVSSTGTVRLNSSGPVTQSSAITASSLGIRTSGFASPVTLTNSANAASVLAANTGGSFSYANNGDLTVGSVTSMTSGGASFTATNGITTSAGSNASLTVNGALTLSQAINSPGGTVTLKANSIALLNSAQGISASSVLFRPFDQTLTLSLAIAAPISNAIISGNVDFASGITLSLALTSGYSPALGDAFHLIDGTITGTTPIFDLPTLNNGLSWDTSEFASAGTIEVVPEPNVLALLAFSALGSTLLLRPRRRA